MGHEEKAGQRGLPPACRVRTGALLALVGGFLDAYTYRCRGGVFSNAQTGNLVRLSMAVPQGDWALAGLALCSVAAFIAGVVTCEAAQLRGDTGRLGWQGKALALEFFGLLAVGLIPARQDTHFWANLLVSYLAAVQGCAFRTLVDAPFFTTMSTGNLRSATAAAWRRLAAGDREQGRVSLRYLTVIAAFCFGAGTGAVTTGLIGAGAVWLCCLPVGGLLAWVACHRQRTQSAALSRAGSH